MIEKIISVLLAPLMFLNTMLPFFLGNRSEQSLAEPIPTELRSVSDYVDFVRENGAPSYATKVFVQQVEPIYELLRMLSGRPFASEEEKHLNANIDETLSELCSYIAENTGLDVELLIATLPNLNRPAELANEVFRFDAAAMRAHVFKLRDRAYAENNPLLGHLLYLYGVYWSIIKEVNIYTRPYAEDPSKLEVVLEIVSADGNREYPNPGILIDPETGLVCGQENSGMVGLGFDVRVFDFVIYSTVDCWQRDLGYGLLYDIVADSTGLFNLAAHRIKFSYAGKEWMIQLWKGNYALASNGFEIGIYNRPRWNFGSFYSAVTDDEMMPLSAKLYHGNELLVERSAPKHWWLTGFKMSKVIYLPETLTMEYSITFPNQEMLKAFLRSVKLSGDTNYRLDGLTFHGVF